MKKATIGNKANKIMMTQKRIFHFVAVCHYGEGYPDGEKLHAFYVNDEEFFIEAREYALERDIDFPDGKEDLEAEKLYYCTCRYAGTANHSGYICSKNKDEAEFLIKEHYALNKEKMFTKD